MASKAGVRPAALVGAAGLALGIGAAGPAPAGQVRELSRAATPLVLKDGRIAHVAIWAVPFGVGATELDAEVKAELAGLVETIATDCFLTAQAIGHVEPEAARAGESLAAHRLARARADRIQKAMVERGLQASAIASVWDWQFLVKEPRVTVWVFRLHEGDDCEGKRLEPPTATPAASAQPGARELPVRAAASPPPGGPPPGSEPPAAKPPAGQAAAPARGATSATQPQPAQLQAAQPPAGQPAGVRPPPAAGAQTPGSEARGAPPMPGSQPPPRPLLATRPAQPPPSLPGASAAANEVLVSPIADQPPATVAPEAPAPVAAETTPPAARSPRGATVEPPRAPDPASPPDPARPVERAKAAPDPASGPRAPEPGAAPSVEPGPRAVAALDPGPDASGGPASLEIVFDTNSSYLPKGAVAELRAFLKALPPGAAREVELVAAVGGAEVKEGGGAGVRYNRWLAERRAGRVADWLKENAAGRRVKVTTGYREDDPSRRVTLRVKAGG